MEIFENLPYRWAGKVMCISQGLTRFSDEIQFPNHAFRKSSIPLCKKHRVDHLKRGGEKQNQRLGSRLHSLF